MFLSEIREEKIGLEKGLLYKRWQIRFRKVGERSIEIEIDKRTVVAKGIETACQKSIFLVNCLLELVV